jgi:hypothetical protein
MAGWLSARHRCPLVYPHSEHQAISRISRLPKGIRINSKEDGREARLVRVGVLHKRVPAVGRSPKVLDVAQVLRAVAHVRCKARRVADHRQAQVPAAGERSLVIEA